MTCTRARGFTLVEALVAITLLALLFGALMPVFQQGLAVLDRGDERTRAVLLAQSLLERQAVPMDDEDATRDLETSGEEGEFGWEVSREPHDVEDGGPPVDLESRGMLLTRVSARVTWDHGGQSVSLATLVLERAP